MYALERSLEEYGRLARQAAFLRSMTESLLRAAGLKPGMRVLDVGSGAGDVALLAAELVGPEGEVVGIDVDGAALEVARGRARSLGLSHVTFVEGDAGTAALDGHFDAAIGRLVLMYQGDPAAAIQRIGGGPHFGGYAWMAGVARGVAPLMTKLGMTDVEQLGLDTLADRIRDDAVATNAVVWTPSFVGAHARTSTV